ncbi:hypothetical protein V5F32_05000 [Xanthobacter oligotrophicus]|uniref:Uncharacterized protein n=1 Tax=Xanthobacter oligotrophicus TaxID=2607286 RepID=A0ABW6ZS25_9HYPH
MVESRSTPAEISSATAAEKSAGKRAGDVMSSAVEARSLIEDIIGPVSIGTKLKTVLPFVANATGLTPRRIRGLWSGEARAILHEEISALRRAREEAIHARNLETRARLAHRCATVAVDLEGPDF